MDEPLVGSESNRPEHVKTQTVPVSKAAPALERVVVLVFLTRLVFLLSAPITLWLIATRRPLAEQGPYFIFWNTQGLTQLIELGVGGLIVQFASHESINLTWARGGRLVGADSSRARLFQLVRDGQSWYRLIALLLLAIGGPAGVSLFSFTSADVHPAPLLPWTATIVSTAAYLTLVPMLCAIEGCGGLMRVQRMRLGQVVTAMLALWAVLDRFGALWGVAAFAIVWFAVAWIWLHVTHTSFLAQIRTRADFRTRVLSRGVQWRTMTSWVAIWAAPQSLTPVILAVHGPGDAGRVGMSLAIATAPFTLASAWLQGRYPQYGAFVALNMTKILRQLATTATLQAISVCLFGTLSAATFLFGLEQFAPVVADRALQPTAIIALGVANIGWLVAQSLASYLRAWREEPMTEAFIVSGLAVTAGSIVVSLYTHAFTTVVVHSGLVLLVALPVVILRFSRIHTANRPTL
jgi:hypothetical protein